MHLPDWMIKANPFTKLITKFMRFPITANEVLLKRGLSEDMAGFTATSIGSYLMAMGMYSLIQEAEVLSGVRSEKDRRYGLDSDERLFNTTMKAIGMTGTTGIAPTMYDMVALMVDQPQMGHRYAESDVTGGLIGVTSAKVEQIQKLLGGLTKGEFDGYETANAAKGLFIPASGFPIIGTGLNTLMKQYTREY
jgi:hypothetical protein